MASILNEMFSKLSINDEVSEKINSVMIYENVVGFIGIGNAGTTTITTNTAYAISKYSAIFNEKYDTSLKICLVDMNVFYPKICTLFGIKFPKKGEGLLPLLKGAAIGDCVVKVQENLDILSASPDDNFEEYYDFEDWQLENILEELKQVYDLVIIDIPNNIPLIYCYVPVKFVDKLFIVRSEDIMSDKYIKKIIDYFFVRGKFNCSRYLIMNIRTNSAYDDNIVELYAKKNNLKLMGIINFEQEIINSEVRGKMFIASTYITNSFKETIKNIVIEILGLEEKEKSKQNKQGILSKLFSKKSKQHEDDVSTLKKRVEDME